MTNEEMKQCTQTIDSFANFNKAFEGWIKDEIPKSIMNTVKEFLSLLSKDSPKPDIFSTANKSIQVEWELNTKDEELYFEFEFEENDIQTFCIIDNCKSHFETEKSLPITRMKELAIAINNGIPFEFDC